MYPGIDGFLGTRASLMLDFVFVAMFAVVPILGWSIYQVRYRRRFQLHKRVQLALAIVLAFAVAGFELDMQIFGWQDRAAGELGGTPSPGIWIALYIHLCFAISTVVLWPLVIIRALRNFPSPPTPSSHSRWHVRWARIAALDMLMTAVTGWVFYVLAFVV
jgi:uncharacterized membrane protein YozB (DUF420 family)